LNFATYALSLTSRALALMGQPGSVYDPRQIPPLAATADFRPTIDSARIEARLKVITLEHYKNGALLLNGH